MQIVLQKVNPLHVEKQKVSGSAVWNREILIEPSAHLHIVAPSGSGKTTLMHFLYGLRNDYSGKIYFDNKELKATSAEEFSLVRRKKVSMIFQDLRLFDTQTVRENIEIKRILDPYHTQQEAEEMCVMLGIVSKLDQLAGTCSYGEQQRIAIIRALMQPFHFLLLDEPFSHLDEVNRQKAMNLIYGECEKRGASMVFADLQPLGLLKGERVLTL